MQGVNVGYGWSYSTAITQNANDKRLCSSAYVLLDPTKTYSFKFINGVSSYYFGVLGATSDTFVKTYDSLLTLPSNTLTVTGVKYAFVNFKYGSAGTTATTQAMADEILSNFVISQQ